MQLCVACIFLDHGLLRVRDGVGRRKHSSKLALFLREGPYCPPVRRFSQIIRSMTQARGASAPETPVSNVVPMVAVIRRIWMICVMKDLI